MSEYPEGFTPIEIDPEEAKRKAQKNIQKQVEFAKKEAIENFKKLKQAIESQKIKSGSPVLVTCLCKNEFDIHERTWEEQRAGNFIRIEMEDLKITFNHSSLFCAEGSSTEEHAISSPVIYLRSDEVEEERCASVISIKLLTITLLAGIVLEQIKNIRDINTPIM